MRRYWAYAIPLLCAAAVVGVRRGRRLRWTTYEDWNAGTKSNVDVETTSGSVLLAEDV